MESDISQVFQKELSCLICLKSLIDPVTIRCGHSFCRACLLLSCEDIQSPVHCPVCREPYQQKNLRTNIGLKNLVCIASQASLRKCLSSEENLCATHKETKKIFCREDRILLCQLCSNSEEHEGHSHCAIEAAVEEQREKVVKQLTLLCEKIQENQRNLNEVNRIIISWMGYVAVWEDMIRTEYQKMQPVLWEEEKQHVESLEREGQSILENLKKSEAKMLQKRNQLGDMYQELVALCRGTYVELLQDLGEILRRSESMQLCMPQVVKPALSSHPIPGLISRSRQYQVRIFLKNAFMIHCTMSLFTNVRRFNFRQQAQDTAGTYYFVCWASQSFASGKYYWELGINDYWDWAVGVCKDSWERKCGPLSELEDMFILVFVKVGDHCSLLTTCPTSPHYVEIPVGQVGVFLDCDNGSVSFLNVAKNALIFSYPAGSFNFPVRPYLSFGHVSSDNVRLTNR